MFAPKNLCSIIPLEVGSGEQEWFANFGAQGDRLPDRFHQPEPPLSLTLL